MGEIKVILKELDEMIKIQERYVESAEQGANEAVVSLETRELAAYMKVKKMINEKMKEEDVNEINDEKSQK